MLAISFDAEPSGRFPSLSQGGGERPVLFIALSDGRLIAKGAFIRLHDCNPSETRGIPAKRGFTANRSILSKLRLTYMSTLLQLADLGKLKKHDPELERDEFPDRHAYLSPEAHAWIEETLVHAARDRGHDLRPYEQVHLLLYEFVIGRPLVYDQQRKKLDPLTQHIWELKTEDVRLIGWFPRKKNFVVVCGRMKKELPKANLYKACIQHAIWFRDILDIDTPKSVTGVRYDDIL
jgi:hypothetical protein